MARAFISVILIAILGYGGWWAYENFIVGPAVPSAAGGPMENPPIPVEAAIVQPQLLSVTISATGNLSASEEAQLRSEIPGRVEKILFDEGSYVKRGMPLFEIDSSNARANVRQAEANADLAEQNLARLQQLSGTGAISMLELDQAKSAQKSTAAALDQAEIALAKANVRAPFSGQLGIRRVRVGDFVQPGQELVQIVNTAPMRIEFSIPENEGQMVSIGQDIAFTTNQFPGETFFGTITAIEPFVENAGRQIKVLAMTANDPPRLRSGGFVDVKITIAEKPDAVMVPESALVPMGGQQFLVLIGADQATEMRPVTLGIRQAGMVEVINGLAAGDTVVTAGQMKLQPGAKAQAINLSSPETSGEAVSE